MKTNKYGVAFERVVLWGSAAFISLSFLLYYLIDLRNVLGSRDWLFSTEGVYFYFTYTPFFFQHYGRNGGFAELMQWSLLAVAIVLALLYAGSFLRSQKRLALFWLIFGVGMMFMLFEDAGDVRHLFMSYIQWAAGEPDQGAVGTAFEGLYFLLLGGIPVYAFIRYGKEIRSHGRAFVYVLVGIILHALAASLSFVGSAFQKTLDIDMYTIMGTWFKSASLRIADPEVAQLWDAWDASNWLYQVDFYLMDSLVEENIELLANAFFLAAALSVFALYFKQSATSKPIPETENGET